MRDLKWSTCRRKDHARRRPSGHADHVCGACSNGGKFGIVGKVSREAAIGADTCT